MKDAKPMPAKLLTAHQIWFERHLASVLMQAIADSGMALEQIDDRMGKTHGFTARFLGRLARGKSGAGKEMVALAAAMDARVECRVKPVTTHAPD